MLFRGGLLLILNLTLLLSLLPGNSSLALTVLKGGKHAKENRFLKQEGETNEAVPAQRAAYVPSSSHSALAKIGVQKRRSPSKKQPSMGSVVDERNSVGIIETQRSHDAAAMDISTEESVVTLPKPSVAKKSSAAVVVPTTPQTEVDMEEVPTLTPHEKATTLTGYDFEEQHGPNAGSAAFPLGFCLASDLSSLIYYDSPGAKQQLCQKPAKNSESAKKRVLSNLDNFVPATAAAAEVDMKDHKKRPRGSFRGSNCPRGNSSSASVPRGGCNSQLIRLPVDEIRFSQDSIGGRFQDGTPLEQTIEELSRGEKNYADIGKPLRVFKHLEWDPTGTRWFSEDNRRLHCFKTALGNLRRRKSNDWENHAAAANEEESVLVRLVPLRQVKQSKLTTQNQGRSVVVRKEGGDNYVDRELAQYVRPRGRSCLMSDFF